MFEQTFKNIDDVLHKDAGCGSELDYVEQSSWVLFLKYLDDLEKERESSAGPTRILGDMHRLSSLRFELSFVRSRLSALRSITDFGEPAHAARDTRRCRFDS